MADVGDWYGEFPEKLRSRKEVARMAHELEIRNGEASMFYVGGAPWHGLGTKLDKPATAAEAIKAAKLDWRVRKVPLHAIEDGVTIPVRNTFGVVRDDLWGDPDCSVLGVVGQEYTPLQNEDAFAFFDPIVGRNAAIYHTAGVLRDGQRIWILAKLPTDIGSRRTIADSIRCGLAAGI